MVQFRQFESENIDQCKTLIGTCSEEVVRSCTDGYDELASARQAELCDLIRTRLCRTSFDSAFCIVALWQDQIIGMGVLDGKTIKSMYINPEVRSKGIGRAIYKKLEAEAWRKKLHTLDLEASINSVGFFEGMGFTPIGEKTLNLDGSIFKNISMQKKVPPVDPLDKSAKILFAFIRSGLVFLGVFFVIGILAHMLLPQAFNQYLSIGPFGTNNLLGFILGVLTATHTFRAALRRNKL